jgi:hypothetical protein
LEEKKVPFIDPGLKPRHLAVIFGFAAAFYLGELTGADIERKARESRIDPAVQVLLNKATFDPRTTNPNDTLLWSAFLPQARTCEECSALKEYNNRLYSYSRPVVYHIYGDEVGNTRDVGYTMVFGLVSISQESGQLVVPQITYYIGHRSGSLARIDGSGLVENRVGYDEWRPIKDGSVLVTQVRNAFQKKWQSELSTPRAQ